MVRPVNCSSFSLGASSPRRREGQGKSHRETYRTHATTQALGSIRFPHPRPENWRAQANQFSGEGTGERGKIVAVFVDFAICPKALAALREAFVYNSFCGQPYDCLSQSHHMLCNPAMSRRPLIPSPSPPSINSLGLAVLGGEGCQNHLC